MFLLLLWKLFLPRSVKCTMSALLTIITELEKFVTLISAGMFHPKTIIIWSIQAQCLSPLICGLLDLNCTWRCCFLHPLILCWDIDLTTMLFYEWLVMSECEKHRLWAYLWLVETLKKQPFCEIELIFWTGWTLEYKSFCPRPPQDFLYYSFKNNYYYSLKLFSLIYLLIVLK